MPVIRVIDGDSGGKRTLVLEHVHDGRDLHPEYAERTLAFVYQLWQHEVAPRDGHGRQAPKSLVHNDRGFTVNSGK